MMTSPRTASRAARRLAVAFVMIGIGACGGGGGESPPTTPPVAPVASVTVAALPAVVYVGATLQLAVTTRDAAGVQLTGRAVTYSSSNNAIATVTSTGLVTATGVGTTTIRVASESQAADVTVNVALVPVVSLVVTPPSATLGLGASLQLTGTPRDSANGALSGRAIGWTSTAESIARVSATGLVTGVAAGTATIRATVDGKVGESAITVSSSASPTITSVSPALLAPGVTATITGTSFGTVTTANTVTIDGVSATVITASETQLTVTVPPLPCQPTHSARVQVIAQGLGATALQPARAGTVVNVTTNAPLLLSAAEAACAELPAAAARYVVSVVNTASEPTSTAGFRLAGALPPATLASLTTTGSALHQSVATPSQSVVRTAGTEPLVNGATRSVAQRLHTSILAENRAAFARLRASRGSLRARTSASRSVAPSGARAATLPAVGETRKFRIAQFSTALNATGSCSNFVEITARAVYIGSHGVIYEDVAAPLASTMDTYYRNLGDEFDRSMYVVDSTYFGDPLVTDPFTDNDRHFNMVFTPSITQGVAGFVTSCDFFQRDSSGTSRDNRESNFGEYFYAVVPTVAGTGFSSGNTPDSWLRGIRHTIVHEVKHIASFGARLTNNATNYEEAWLEEGMARHAEELWERNAIYNVPWKGNTGYRESLYCDVRPTNPSCTGRPYAMFNHFGTLYSVLDNPGASSLFGRVADGDFSFYASSWSLVRYALDRYATSEASFLRGITQSATTSGMASITAQTGGHSTAELLANWSLAMYFDDQTTNADINFPTWNTHDIYAGMNADFPKPDGYPKAFPLTPTAVSAAFVVDNDGIHGGSFAMYIVPANAGGPSTLQLVAAGGAGSANPSLRIALVRTP